MKRIIAALLAATCLLLFHLPIGETRRATVFLIRHGESTWNSGGAGGWRELSQSFQAEHFNDAPLNGEGVHDAENLNRHFLAVATGAADTPDRTLARQILAGAPNVEVLASPLSRAHDTATFALKVPAGTTIPAANDQAQAKVGPAHPIVHVAPFLQETCSNRDCSARLPAMTKPTIARMHSRALGDGNLDHADGLRETFVEDLRKNPDAPNDDILKRVKYLAGDEVRVEGDRGNRKLALTRPTPAAGGAYATFDMTLWNLFTLQSGKTNGAQRMLDHIATATESNKDVFVIGGHSMWLKSLGAFLRTQNLAAPGLEDSSHSAKIFLRGHGKALTNLFSHDDKLANGGCLKLTFDVTQGAPANPVDVQGRQLSAAVNTFATRHGLPNAAKQNLLTKLRQTPGSAAKRAFLKQTFGSALGFPGERPLNIRLVEMSVFYDGQGGRAFLKHKLFRNGDKQYVVKMLPFQHSWSLRSPSPSERILEVLPVGAVGTRGAGVVVSVFKFGGKSKTSFKFTGTPGAAGDAVDASKVIFWPQAATKVAQGGQRGLAGFVQRGNIAFNGAKVNALELSGPNAGRAVTAIRTALTTGGSGKAVRMLPPQWKKKNKASYASVDVTVAGNNVVVTFQNSDGQAGTMTFTGRPIAYRAGTRGVSQHKAQLENVGSVVFWTGLKKGTVYVAQGQAGLADYVKGRGRGSEQNVLRLVTAQVSADEKANARGVSQDIFGKLTQINGGGGQHHQQPVDGHLGGEDV